LPAERTLDLRQGDRMEVLPNVAKLSPENACGIDLRRFAEAMIGENLKRTAVIPEQRLQPAKPMQT